MPGRNQSDCCVEYRSTINRIYHDSSSTDLDIRYCPIRVGDYSQEDTQTKSSKPHNVHRRPLGDFPKESQTLGISKPPQVLVSNTAPAQEAGGGPSAES